jgi:hypothetical protein
MPKVEIYTSTRRAQLLLNSAVDAEDYQFLREIVRQLGLNSDEIEHDPPDPDWELPSPAITAPPSGPDT